MNLNPYSIFDYVLVDYLEPQDLIQWEGEPFTVVEAIALEDGYLIKAIDSLEDDVELIIPDNSIIPLLTEE
jgi:hypothetical protein